MKTYLSLSGVLARALAGLSLVVLMPTADAASAASFEALTLEAQSLSKAGNHAGALAAGQGALVEGERRLGGDSVRLVPLLNLVGDSHRALDTPAPALTAYLHAADLMLRAGKSESSEMAHTVFRIASARLDAEDFVGAAGDFAKVIDILDMVSDATRPNSAEALLNLGYCHVRLKNHTVAAIFYSRSLEVERSSPRPDVHTQAAALIALGSIHRQRERFAESQAFYRQALSIQESVLGPKHLNLAATLTGLALVFEDQGKFTEAEAAFLRAAEIGEAAGAEGTASLRTTLSQLMGMYSDIKDDTNVTEVARRLEVLAVEGSGRRTESPVFPKSD